MARRIGWIGLTLLALLVCAYAVLVYIAFDPRARPDDVSKAVFENPIALYVHIAGAVLALAIGPAQFFLRRLTPAPRAAAALPWHRWLGRIYAAGVLVGVSAGFYLALQTDGGPVANVGFAVLAVLTLGTTAVAYARIRAGRESEHRAWMVRSYALICAAISLRIILPLCEEVFGLGHETSFAVIAWLSWLPNIAIAELMLRQGKQRHSLTSVQTMASSGALTESEVGSA